MPGSDDVLIDERGHRCPAPVIALARAARSAVTGQVLVVLADDPAAALDIPAWCRMTGHEFLSAADEAVGSAYSVRITRQ